MNTNYLFFKMLEGQNIDNKYYLKSLLGAGGFGGVYLADEVVRDRKIRSLAVKLIITDNPDKQLEELIFSTTLQHQNLITCYTCGESKINGTDFLYLLMEQAELSLEDKLKQGKLSETEAEKVILDIAKALEFLHNHNPIIVHRDLKPGNVLKVGENWKLSDFGLVRAMQSNATQTTTMMGTNGYAPPEAYQGKISSAWDIWSLGVLIYEILTGELPFNSDTPLALMQQVIKEQPDLNKLPEKWRKIMGKCLEKESVNRLTASNLIKNISSVKTSNKSLEIDSNESSQITFEFYLNQGDSYCHLEQYQEAITNYNKAIALNSQSADAYNNRGLAYGNLQKYQEAIADFTKAIAINPQDAEAYHNRGNAYRNFKKYEKAIADYTKVIKIDPHNVEALYIRGLVYRNLEKYEEAITDYNKVITIKPQFANAYNNRGNVYYNLKKYQEAIANYSKVIEIDPQFSSVYDNRANAYLNLQKYEDAIIDYSHLIKLNPNHENAYYNRANCYKNLQKYEESIIDYSNVINLNSQNQDAYNNRGLAYYFLQKYEEAITDYSQAIALNPRKAVYYNNKGLAYYSLQKYEEAITDYSQAIALNQQADAHYNRGLAYYLLKRYSKAKEDLQKAANLYQKQGRQTNYEQIIHLLTKIP